MSKRSVVAASAVALLAISTGSAAGAATHHAAHPAARRFAVAQQTCASVGARCLAQALVAAKASTPGARALAGTSHYPLGPDGVGLTPADLATAYGVNASREVHETVATVDAFQDPNALADLDTFDKAYGLPAETSSTFRQVGQNGTATLPVNPSATQDQRDLVSGWIIEQSLDVQALRAMCHTCRVLLVEANSQSIRALAAGVDGAVKDGAGVVSNSYGFPETINATNAARVTKAFHHPGVVITAATGDDGWYGWDLSRFSNGEGLPDSSENVASAPSTYPNVVAVGGTRLSLHANATRSNETVWNENGRLGESFNSSGSTGGGCSVRYSAPRWQRDVAGYHATGCGGYRLAADVAADADPFSGLAIHDSYVDPQDNDPDCPGPSSAPYWCTVGGTSLASPLVAGMWALAGGAHGVADPATSLYGHFTGQPSSLFDVTEGDNGYCDESPAACLRNNEDTNPNQPQISGSVDCAFSQTSESTAVVAAHRQCYSGPGYDGPSGVGTPRGLTAFEPVAVSAAIRVRHHARSLTARFVAHLHDAVPGAAAGARYEWIWGDGRRTTTRSPGVRHTYRRAGHYTVVLRVVDAFGRSARVVTRRGI